MPAGSAPQPRRSPSRDLSARTAWRCVLVCIACAAAIRFFRLGYPPALTDEAFTYWRVCGTFPDLLRALRPDGFVPLHYETLWLLTRLFGFDIWVLRLPGALTGALFPWALYLLARALWDRRAGVTAAALAAASAWFAFFSRDAKMYMPAWCWLTASVAFALLYARAGRRRDLLLATLFGIAAGGTHAVTLLILPMLPLLILVRAPRHRARRTLSALLATAIILAGPLTYYATFSRWAIEAGGLSGVRDDGAPAEHDNGLAWVGRWQTGRTPQNILLSCISSYLLAYEWPAFAPTDTRTPSEKAQQPWGEHEAFAMAKSSLLAIAALLAASLLTTLLRRQPASAGRDVLLCTLLILAPLYGFYLRSFHELAPPWALLPGGPASTFAGAVALLAAIAWKARPDLRRRQLAFALTAGALLLAEWAILRVLHAHAPRSANGAIAWNNLWMPRYSAVVAPFILAALAGAFSRLPTRWLRGLALTAFLAVNLLAITLRLTTTTERPLDLQARDAVATLAPNAHTLMALNITFAGQPWYPPLPTPYYQFVRAAGLTLRPQTFRQGNTWPFLPAAPVLDLISRFRIVPAWSAPAQAARLHADTLILWRTNPSDAPPVWPGWSLTSQTTYDLRHVWTWTHLARYERCVYTKSK